MSKAVYDLLQNLFGKYMLPVKVGVSKNVEEGSLVQEPLLAYDNGKNKSKVTYDYLKLTKAIMEEE